MNSTTFYPEITSKRVKERSIGDAYYRVQQWRYLFRYGIEENGILKKVNLKQAADLVRVPKKTLEDYIQIFNKAQLIINIEEISEKKMGYLRSYMKKNKSKIRKAMNLDKQKQREEKLHQQQTQEVSENTQQNKSEDEYQKFTYSIYPTEQCEFGKDDFEQDADWEYSILFLNNPQNNPHFD
ncbi:unnamed protein product (macronuclear) [Paramecium tetraurelia]|uniref:Uncharacterized protein n=1 Tax=Paramecium tetraurelia TaxID=5888 RepID=A0DC47_PARTE|nr:uncharacterized protein GSPATT00015491001 [Paramecium tetraurelia]CAK80614.1 unnamed protein product [Paramecium tetraurelia]|eukprot:XP_001448011.1 hypothetical protein (macronuclear) [Paramecium tetraurelia strain d4-2]